MTLPLEQQVKLNPLQRQILVRLAQSYRDEGDWGAFSFAPLARSTGAESHIVRRACRSLARKGYAKYERALWNDDGPAGAGYRATEEGKKLFDWCEHEYCDEEATHVSLDGGYKTCIKHADYQDSKLITV